MKKAGFQIPIVGIESGNELDLKLYNKRCTYEDNIRILKMLNHANIYSGSFRFIMFNPFSDWERIERNYWFLAKQKVS